MARKTAEIVNAFYDDVMFRPNAMQNKLGFLNVGYWKDAGDSMEIAQIRLIEELVSFLEKGGTHVLDVACGKGASTKFLTKYFDPEKITGINISEKQLQVCRTIAPECRFLQMDATKLEFEPGSIDNILCIEAAFHFMTRRRFLQEAFRVLKTNGRLAMSDILFGPKAHEVYPSVWEENYLPTLEAYRSCLRDIGFRHVRLEDSTPLATDALFKAIERRLEADFTNRHARGDYEAMLQFKAAQPTCCMVYAIK